jgi:hypothetical protein
LVGRLRITAEGLGRTYQSGGEHSVDVRCLVGTVVYDEIGCEGAGDWCQRNKSCVTGFARAFLPSVGDLRSRL